MKLLLGKNVALGDKIKVDNTRNPIVEIQEECVILADGNFVKYVWFGDAIQGRKKGKHN